MRHLLFVMARKLSPRQRKEEARQRRNRMLMGVFVILVMVFSVFAFAIVFFGPGMDQSGYGFQYEVRDNQLFVRTSAGMVQFFNFPDERYVLSEQAGVVLREADMVVLAFAPVSEQDVELADFVRFDLSNYFDIASARSTNTSLYEQFPVVSCSDATASEPVVLFTNESVGATLSDSCIIIGASGQDVLFARDALLYAYFDLV